MNKSLCVHKSSFPLGKYLTNVVVGSYKNIHLTVKEIAKLFSKSAAASCILSNNYESSSCSTSSTHRVCQFFYILAILVSCGGISWYF